MPAQPARYACGWCEEPNRWPDCCPGQPPDAHCVDEIAWRHELGDHRRCDPRQCDGFVLLQEVITRGQHEARKANMPLVVVNTMTDPWSYRPFERLQQAKPYRSRVGKAAGAEHSIEFKTKVFIVTAEGSVI